MRQIKFRGKAKSNGEWVYGDLFRTHEKYHSPHTSIIDSDFYSYGYGNRAFVEVDPETVGQFTGLKDKNGKEIYEGDIIKAPDSSYIVKWNVNGNWSYRRLPEGFSRADLPVWDGEIIGNIHDNPELMEK